MKRFNKLTAWLLTLAMLMTFIPSFTFTASAADATAKITGVVVKVNGTEQPVGVLNIKDGDTVEVVYQGENFDKLTSNHKYRVGANGGSLKSISVEVDTTVIPNTATKTFSASVLNSSTWKTISYTNAGESETVSGYTINYNNQNDQIEATPKITGVKVLINNVEQPAGEIAIADSDEVTIIYTGENFEKLGLNNQDYKYRIGTGTGNFYWFTINTTATLHTATKTYSGSTIKSGSIGYTNKGEEEVIVYTIKSQQAATPKITGVKVLINNVEQPAGEIVIADSDEVTIIYTGENFEKLGLNNQDYKYRIGPYSGNFYSFTIDTTVTPHTATKTYSGSSINYKETIAYTNKGESETVTGYIMKKPTPVDVELKVTKSINDWNAANSFTFNLAAIDGAPLPSNTTAMATESAPMASFGMITYEAEGTYKYTITEVNDNIPGITYDTTPHQVVVTVTKGTDNKLSAVVTYDGKSQLIITNTYTQPTVSVSISAVNIVGGVDLAGAQLQLLDGAGDVVVINGAKMEWVSTNNAHTIEGLKTDKEYTIRATVAPNGFVNAADTEFRIDATLGLVTTGSVTAEGVILIEFAPTKARISAVDIAHGNALSGAKIQIVDKSNNVGVVEEWISNGSVHEVTGLTTGKEYTLKAVVAPNGYTIPDETKFTIDENGNVTSTGTVDRTGALLVEFGTISTYTVTTTADPTEGGTVTGGGTYTENTSVTVTATANNGYKFDGWYKDDIWVSDDESYTFTVTEDCELKAEFAKLYTITYHANNGTNATDSESVADGGTATLTADVFTYGKCEIESWNTEADGSGDVYYIDGDITVTEDTTLYAQWVLPLNRYDSFSEGDYEWSGNTASPYNFTMKNGAVLYARVIFPANTNDDKTTITVNGDCEIKGSLSFVSGTGLSGSNHRGDLTIKGDGTLKFYEMSSTGTGDTLTVETDVTVVSSYMFIGASGGEYSKIVIKDATLTLHNLTLLQYLTMEGEAKLNIINGTASFHSDPQITLSNKSEIYIGGNGSDCVLYKEGEDNNADFDELISNGWIPEGFSFKIENYGYYLYNAENNLATDAITIKKPGYTVTFKDWDGSELDTQSVSHGSAATAPQNPTREGWTFTGWDKAFDNVTGDLTVTAQYVENTVSRPSSGGGATRYTIKFDTNGGNSITSKNVARNRTVAEPDVPVKDGYTFIGWYTDEGLTIAYDFESKVTKSIVLYAKWEKHDDDDSHGTGAHDCPSLDFDDLDITQWYHLDTDYVIANGIFKGTAEKIFEPHTAQTRAMMVTVLYRAEGEPAVNRSIPFADVDMGAYYANAVIWAQQNGIIKGYSETKFGPNDNITREQIAAIMHRFAQYKGIDVSVGENTNILSYEDFDEISEYAVSSMQWAVGSGMIKGRTESTLNPKAFATRVEIAAMLHRFIEANK